MFKGYLFEMSINIENFHKTLFQDTSPRYTCRHPRSYLKTNHEDSDKSGKSGKHGARVKDRVTSRLWIAFILQIF